MAKIADIIKEIDHLSCHTDEEIDKAEKLIRRHMVNQFTDIAQSWWTSRDYPESLVIDDLIASIRGLK